MMKNFTIQSYTDDYRDALVKLILPIQQQEFGVSVTIDDQPDLLTIPSFYQANNGNFWIALHEGELIGTIGLIDIGFQAGAIRKMFVRKDFRGREKGVGQALLDTTVNWCLDHKIRQLYLGTVPQLQGAIRFYQKNGFQAVAAEELPHYFPRMAVDSEFFTKDLLGTATNTGL